MDGTVLLLMVGVGIGVCLLVLVSAHGGDDQDQDPGTEGWRCVNAEVLSVLRTNTCTFLLVRYQVGSSLIRRDVRYPLAGPVPHAGRSVPIRFDPRNPARVMFDLQHSMGISVAGPTGSGSDWKSWEGRPPAHLRSSAGSKNEGFWGSRFRGR